MKTLFIIFSLLLLQKIIQTQDFFTLIESFTPGFTIQNATSQGWQAIGSSLFFQGPCEYFPTINSGNIIDESKILIDIQMIPNHSQLQISYEMACPGLSSVMTLLIDGNIAHTMFSDNQAPSSQCLFNFPTQNISFTYPHTSENLTMIFNVTQETSEYCGIRNFVILYDQLDEIDPQYCFDQIGNLTDSNGTTLMNNTCTAYVENDEQRFNFTTSFLAPYELDTDCFSLEVQYSNTTLQEGSSDIDEWNFDPNTQEINWSIKLDDFVDKYNCSDSLSTDSSFIWLCEYQINIYHQSILQLEYKAKIQVTLNRNAVDNISLVVLPNQVEGACCENQLNVTTQLNICEDFTCQNYTQAPYQFQRSEPFYVEQIITNPEFDHYYLKYVEAKLGPVLLQILQFDASIPGKLRLKLQSSIALSGNVLQVISQLHNVPYSPLSGTLGRRMLMNEQEALQQLDNNDYKIASYEQIDVIDGDQQQQQIYNEDQVLGQKVTYVKQIEESNNSQLILLGAASLLFLTIVSLLVICLVKCKRKGSKQSNEQKQSNEEIEIRIDSQEQELAKNQI